MRPLYEAIEEQKVVINSNLLFTEDNKNEYNKAIYWSSAVQIVRTQMKVEYLFMKYTQNTPERPLGQVRNIWRR